MNNKNSYIVILRAKPEGSESLDSSPFRLRMTRECMKIIRIVLFFILIFPSGLRAEEKKLYSNNVKYSPFAKQYIERAMQKLEDTKGSEHSMEIEAIDKEMANKTIESQIPPYLEPPIRNEEAGTGPLIEPPPLRKKLREKKITLDFDKVDLKSVINFISQEAGVNILLSQKVLDLGVKVSVRFKDVPIDEVLKYIAKSQGLVFRIDKDMAWVLHPEEIAGETMETRVYYLLRGGGLFTEFSPITSSGSASGSGSGGGDTSLGSSSAQITKVLTMEDTLKEAVSWPGESKLVYDKRLNALIVRNTPQNLQTLEDILFGLDVTPCQLLIEARFIEVNITDTEELGMEWKLNQNFPLSKKNPGTGQDGASIQQILKDSGAVFSAFTRAAEGFNFTYQGLMTNPQFQVVLHALEESSKAKTLSSPRITTLNNQLATFKVVDEWIYPTRYEYEIVQFDINGDGDYKDAGETAYKNVPKDFQRRDVGILLKVLPSVGADKKTIALSLIPEVSEGTADFFSYAGQISLPKFTSSNLSTNVVIASGETVVMGGLIKESRTHAVTKVPIMGDIPLFGNLFKKNSDSIERKNLLIFVTAKIIAPSGEELVITDKRR